MSDYTLEEFVKSTEAAEPPEGISGPLKAMWVERARDDWHGSHEIVQVDDSADASWVHAYLHRKEPDPGNAAYWYRRAGRKPFNGSYEEEWESIVKELLGR